MLWVQVDGGVPGSAETLLLGFCYFPQRPTPWTRAAEAAEELRWLQLEEDLRSAQRVGWAALAGDFNACTASEPDWPAGQEPDAPPRNSCDTETCERGKRLLQLCQAHGLRLCNGRVEGDDPGAPTSYGIGGRRSSKSVVDYFLLPAALLPQVESLRVEDLAVGNHAALVLRLGPPTRARPRRPRQRRQAARRRRHHWHARSQQQRQGQRRPPPPRATLAGCASAAMTAVAR